MASEQLTNWWETVVSAVENDFKYYSNGHGNF